MENTSCKIIEVELDECSPINRNLEVKSKRKVIGHVFHGELNSVSQSIIERGIEITSLSELIENDTSYKITARPQLPEMYLSATYKGHKSARNLRREAERKAKKK